MSRARPAVVSALLLLSAACSPAKSPGGGDADADDLGGVDGADGADGADGSDGTDGGSDGSDGGSDGSDGGSALDCTAADGDPFEFIGARVLTWDLWVNYGASGGCEEHTLSLCWPGGALIEGRPPRAVIDLIHDAHGDSCEAWIEDEVPVSLIPIVEAAGAMGWEGEVEVELYGEIHLIEIEG